MNDTVASLTSVSVYACVGTLMITDSAGSTAYVIHFA
jgi:hypothetical protein